jgi:DNA-binding transcriptional regulator YhcF (GntR family)
LKKHAPSSKVTRNGSHMSQGTADANRYLYEQIYSELKEEILSGKYRKGDWFPPERVLKDRFNTTHLTVRNALAKLVLEGYIERYSGKGTIVIYARERAITPRKLLAFPWAHAIIESLDEANATLLESLEAQLRKVPVPLRFSCHHGDVLLGQGIYREARGSGALVVLQPAGVGASLLPPGELPENTIVIRSMVIGWGCPQVATDDVEAGRRAARHLRGLGYDKIAFLTPGLSPASGGLGRGFADELAAAGMPAGAGVTESCAPGIEGGVQAVRGILSREPSCRAFLCASDVTAAGAITGLREAGLQAGSDCTVVGYGNTPLAATVRLTSIDPRLDLLAQRAVATVMEGMRLGRFTGDVFLIAPELCIRESSARPALRRE